MLKSLATDELSTIKKNVKNCSHNVSLTYKRHHLMLCNNHWQQQIMPQSQTTKKLKKYKEK